ncbi:hypothetical protein PAPYR_10688 [Paratrimastix pyriformis]|uniref:Uncharacterized protein n=1 Tax=Paratrimastix pyriformis TaxID=342808 RepID=A0ABQ8U896_9EUKA|nr:hypothetical protein PAPYR_11972 [Paratrimastix pyriformis]KAJ4454567.1 hypothetical protein PAPYR_10688 [Paratrimastix pyriformis]
MVFTLSWFGTRRLHGKVASTASPAPPPLSLTRRAPPGAGRDPLEEMFGVRMVDHESLFFVFFETFGSCDSQLDCLLRCAVLTPFPPYSASVAGVSSSEWAYA